MVAVMSQDTKERIAVLVEPIELNTFVILGLVLAT